MYELFKDINDLIFYAVAGVAIVLGIMRMRKNKNKDNDKNDTEK